MKFAALLPLLILLLVACGGGGGGAGATPRESFETWKSAMSAKDWDATWELVPPSDRAKAEAQIEKGADEIARDFGLSEDEVRRMSPKELFGVILDKNMENRGDWLKNLDSAEFVREKIDDTRARVTYKVKDAEETVRMVSEDGKWYVRFALQTEAPPPPVVLATTPRATFEAMKSALSGGDWGAIFDLISPVRREKMTKEIEGEEDEVATMLGMTPAEVKAMSVKEIFVALMKKFASMGGDAVQKAAGAEYVGEEIDGDKARVSFTQDGKERSLKMVRIDGKWFIDQDMGM